MTQAQALSILKTGVNVYLSGSAGSGKTYTLNAYIEYLKEHNISVAVTASTGIAATHMNGMTIHGFAGIGVREYLSDYELDALLQKPYLVKRFEKTKVLIIDEVSMLHARTLDMVDRVARAFKRNDIPFGGMQVILSGDFFQLPPVTKRAYGDAGNQDIDEIPKDMIVYADAWREMRPAICYLTEQHRQEDAVFTGILNAVRSDSVGAKEREHIRSRINATLSGSVIPTKLYTHNVDVDAINQRELATLDGKGQTYQMSATGRDVLIDILKKSCLAHEVLCLKPGAQVMFIKNNFELGYVNGTRGIVEQILSNGTPVVRLLDGRIIHVVPESWAIEEDGKQKAAIMQLPLRLAWAITIHKSQGMSLDAAEIDLSKTLTYGMGYVALSRVRTLAGVRLVGYHDDALQVDPAVLALDEKLRMESEANEELFGKLTKEAQAKLEHDFIVRMGGSLKKVPKAEQGKKVSTVMQTKTLLDEGKTIQAIAKIRDLNEGTIIDHIEKLVASGEEVKLDHVRPDQKDIDAVARHLKGADGKLSPLKSALDREGKQMSFEAIRLARVFVTL
ncbi:MAG TPA: helix-turn-helix domain-containing protein [Blastocatellia bacterium]|nr:helix-turn-helix domain-containing protein [Blastocatellia bacterium]